ncbi:hypothetical protein Tco_0999219 [Tanacetum coccineum]
MHNLSVSKDDSDIEDKSSWTHSQAVNKSPTHYPCDSARTFRVILFSIHNDEWKSFQCHHQTALRRPYALSWKPCQGDSLNLPDHRIHKDGDGDASFQLKSDSLPHAHAQTTKTFYKHQDSRIMKAQELKTKTSAQTLIYKIFLQRYQVYQGRLLASFQDDAKYEHGSDTSDTGHLKSRDKRCKMLEEDLAVPWICEDVDLFTPQICNFRSSRKTRMPNNVKTYDRTRDPEDHLRNS